MKLLSALFYFLLFLTLAARPVLAEHRIVVLPQDVLEVVRLLGGMPQVVGVSHHAADRRALMPEVTDLLSVGSGFSPNFESIAALTPDVVIAWREYPGMELEQRLKPFGIRVVRLDMHLPENLEPCVQVLADLLGGEAHIKGEAFLRWVRQAESNLKGCIPANAEPPTVLARHFVAERLAGPGSALFDLTVKAGGNNPAKVLHAASSTINMEWVAEQNPAVIIQSVSLSTLDIDKGQEQLVEARTRLMGQTDWRDMAAVRTGRVYALASDVLGGPRWVVGLAAMIEALYPDAQCAPCAVQLHDEYLRLFQAGKAGGAIVAP